MRQSLCEQLNRQGSLPLLDRAKMAVNFASMVRITEPLDLEKYPELKKVTRGSRFCCVDRLIGQEPYTWNCFSPPGGRVSWSVMIQFSEGGVLSKEEDGGKNDDWGPEAA